MNDRPSRRAVDVAARRVRPGGVGLGLRQCRLGQDPRAGAARDPPAARGTPPEKILCLTFTKAAAANMANRVFETLAHWTTLDDAALDAEIAGIGAQARRAAAHACAAAVRAGARDAGRAEDPDHPRLLHAAAAPVPVRGQRRGALRGAGGPHDSSELIDRLRMACCLRPPRAGQRARPGLATASRSRPTRHSPRRSTKRSRKRDELEAWIAPRAASTTAIGAAVARARGRDRTTRIERVEADIVDGPHLPMSEWDSRCDTVQAGSSNDQKQCDRFMAAIAASGERRVEDIPGCLLHQKARASQDRSSPARSREAIPTCAQRLRREQDARLRASVQRRRAVETRERTAALVTIAARGDRALSRREEPARPARLRRPDRQDARAARPNAHAAWVHYKLDLGIDHVLIDEAQDTSPEQWEIVKRADRRVLRRRGRARRRRARSSRSATRSSRSSRSRARSRRSSPRCAALSRQRSRVRRCAFARREVRATRSARRRPCWRRSTRCSGAAQAHAGLTEIRWRPMHEAVRAAAPGVVESGPMIEPDDKARDRWLGRAVRRDAGDEPARAARAADRPHGEALDRAATVGDGAGRAVRAGDILVLVRQRGALFEAVISALKKRRHRGRGRRPAGADRAYRRDGPDGARRRAAAAGRRPCARHAC